MSDRERVEIFRSAWEIIEHVDALRCFFGNDTFFRQVSGYRELKGFFYSSKRLRDKKVHLSQRTRNLADKNRSLPLHGIIKFTHSVKTREFERGYKIEIISMEPIMHGFAFAADDGIKDIFYEVDNIILQGLDEIINITRLFDCISEFSAKLKDMLRDNEKVALQSGALLVSSLPEAQREPWHFRVDVTKDTGELESGAEERK
ncbi:MAG: hypothetical protein AAF526_01420 [Pseudomonadota bacterium]